MQYKLISSSVDSIPDKNIFLYGVQLPKQLTSFVVRVLIKKVREGTECEIRDEQCDFRQS